MWTVLLIIALLIASPFAILWTMNNFPKKDLFKKQCDGLLLLANNKIEIQIDKLKTAYTYQKGDTYGPPYTKERYFENGLYQSTNNFQGDIPDAMQSRIDQIESKTPEAKIEITFPE